MGINSIKQDRKIVVTGGSGLIGSIVSHELRSKGYTVREFDRHTNPAHDITNKQAVQKALIGADTVIHLAGVLGTSELLKQPADAAYINTYGTANVLEACMDEEVRFLGISMPDAFIDTSIYTITKTAGINMAKALHTQMGLPVAHVRAFNAYGPGQHVGGKSPRKIVPAFACEAWLGRPLIVWGDGTQGVDLISTYELGRLFCTIVERGEFKGETYDGGSGVLRTVNEVAEMVLAATNKPGLRIQHMPMRLGETPTAIRATGEGWDKIGWQPSPFIDSLFQHTVDSYQMLCIQDTAGINTWLDDSIGESLA